MNAQWQIVTAPTEEPISLADAKLHARIVDPAGDTVLQAYIVAARQAAESKLSRGLLTQTWQLQLSAFADVIYLPMAAPLQSVTSVKCYDAAGVLQTVDAARYVVDTVSRPGRIVRAPGQTWPGLQADRLAGAVVIVYVVGWTAAAQVPERIKQGMRLAIAAADLDRDGYGDRAEEARAASEACWDDVVYWIEPGAAG